MRHLAGKAYEKAPPLALLGANSPLSDAEASPLGQILHGSNSPSQHNVAFGVVDCRTRAFSQGKEQSWLA